MNDSAQWAAGQNYTFRGWALFSLLVTHAWTLSARQRNVFFVVEVCNALDAWCDWADFIRMLYSLRETD